MKITCASTKYSPDAVKARYVRKPLTGEDFQFCEVGEDRRYDLRQGIVSASEIPEGVAMNAYAMMGQAFSYVEWPFDLSE